jgi:hypothetical protein
VGNFEILAIALQIALSKSVANSVAKVGQIRRRKLDERVLIDSWSNTKARFGSIKAIVSSNFLYSAPLNF